MVNIENWKNIEHHSSYKKTLVLSIICSKCKNEDEKIFKEEKLNILGFIENI